MRGCDCCMHAGVRTVERAWGGYSVRHREIAVAATCGGSSWQWHARVARDKDAMRPGDECGASVA